METIEIDTGMLKIIVISAAMPVPITIPIAPPKVDISADSIRNCRIRSFCLAPSALRIPISRVRSVTETSMMFMITMPPTTSEIEANPNTIIVNSELICFQISRKVSLVSSWKLSSASGASCRLARMITRVWSSACSITCVSPLARE